MIRIVGTWELGWNTPIKEADLWKFLVADYGVDEWMMTPISGINDLDVNEHPDMGSVITEARALGQTVVFVDEGGSETLNDFSHPENVLYVFGKASFSPLVSYYQPGDLSVRIETPNALGGFWPHQAASVVLYDRMVKSWPLP